MPEETPRQNEEQQDTGEAQTQQSTQQTGGNQNQQNLQQNSTLMGVLCYLGILVLIPYFSGGKSDFVKFHAGQGLTLFILEIATWVLLGMIIPGLWFVSQILNLVWLVLSIMGIMNVVNNQKKEIPVVGQLAKQLNL